MKQVVMGGLVGAAILLTALAAGAENDLDAHTRLSREVIEAFAKSLKAELTTAIEASGPAAAIELCNHTAPNIVSRHALEDGLTLGRTSLKLRNPDNAPDAWERTILQSFEVRRAAGEDPATIEHAAIIMRDGRRVIHYMKAIPTGELCLNCHGGDEVKPEVAAKLAKYYPDDKARGFSVGDIRGAFTIVKPAE